MPTKRVEYNKLAATYNQRFKKSKQEQTAAKLQSLALDLAAQNILEVGCGTGRWLADLRQQTSFLYGLDLSDGMLNQAHHWDCCLHLLQGRAERLPFPSGKFDLVYCINAIHHFDRPDEFIYEAFRLLQPAGVCAVIGMDPHGHYQDWYVYRYFKGTYDTDLARFPSWDEVMDWMSAAGFEYSELRHVERIVDPKIGSAVLQDPFLKKETTSQLALLSQEAYTAGLDLIDTSLREAEKHGKEIIFPVDLQLMMLVGWKTEESTD